MSETNTNDQNDGYTHLVEWGGAKYGVIADSDEAAELQVRDLAAEIDKRTSSSHTRSSTPTHLSSEMQPRIEPMPQEMGQQLGYLAGQATVSLLSFERQS